MGGDKLTVSTMEAIELINRAEEGGKSAMHITLLDGSVGEFMRGLARGYGLEVEDVSEEEMGRESVRVGLLLALLTGMHRAGSIVFLNYGFQDGIVIVLKADNYLVVYGVSRSETYLLYIDPDGERGCLRIGMERGVVMTSD